MISVTPLLQVGEDTGVLHVDLATDDAALAVAGVDRGMTVLVPTFAVAEIVLSAFMSPAEACARIQFVLNTDFEGFPSAPV